MVGKDPGGIFSSIFTKEWIYPISSSIFLVEKNPIAPWESAS